MGIKIIYNQSINIHCCYILSLFVYNNNGLPFLNPKLKFVVPTSSKCAYPYLIFSFHLL